MEETVATTPPEILAAVIQHFLSWAYMAAGGTVGIGLIVGYFIRRWFRKKDLREKLEKEEALAAKIAAAQELAHKIALEEDAQRFASAKLEDAREEKIRALGHRLKVLEDSRERMSARFSEIDKADYITRKTADDILESDTKRLDKEIGRLQERVDHLYNGRKP